MDILGNYRPAEHTLIFGNLLEIVTDGTGRWKMIDVTDEEKTDTK